MNESFIFISQYFGKVLPDGTESCNDDSHCICASEELFDQLVRVVACKTVELSGGRDPIYDRWIFQSVTGSNADYSGISIDLLVLHHFLQSCYRGGAGWFDEYSFVSCKLGLGVGYLDVCDCFRGPVCVSYCTQNFWPIVRCADSDRGGYRLRLGA